MSLTAIKSDEMCESQLCACVSETTHLSRHVFWLGCFKVNDWLLG